MYASNKTVGKEIYLYLTDKYRKAQPRSKVPRYQVSKDNTGFSKKSRNQSLPGDARA